MLFGDFILVFVLSTLYSWIWRLLDPFLFIRCGGNTAREVFDEHVRVSRDFVLTKALFCTFSNRLE
jgi:hypothetical protein